MGARRAEPWCLAAVCGAGGYGACGLQEAEAGGAVRRRSPAVGGGAEMLRGGWTRPPRLGLFTEPETEPLQGKRLGSPELTRPLHFASVTRPGFAGSP